MTATPIKPDLTRLDVRAVLAAGGEPFDLIMAAAGRIPPGGALELTAPFEPLPLYDVMRRRGFSRTTEARGPAEWVVTFRDTGISPTATLADVATQHPATREVFGRHGLDLCCGGAKTLAFAAQAHGVNLDRLLEELQAAAG
ncbi:MAG TPA: DUF542 domain-containing protein [Gemmatimonadales bacterium]|jgi:hypothetical protein